MRASVSDPPDFDDLVDRIRRREAVVGILGLGYVGLPLALAFADARFRVLGFDTDPAKVEALRQGRSYLDHIADAKIRAVLDAGRFAATGDPDRLAEPDALLICVPTPLDPHRRPDLSHVESTVRDITRRLRRRQLVVLESTTYPGTTAEVLRPLLESSGLTCGRDFLLAFSPEREDPGNRDFATTSVPKVVGGLDEVAGRVAEALYGEVFAATVRVSSARAAEATKLAENVFRAVNIALVNELKVVFDAMDVDVWEVLDAAATKPFGFMRFTPGPGWGGHCIPVDPFYLSWKASQLGRQARFVELAGEVNVAMPRWVLDKLEGALASRGKALSGSRVLVLGVAYKPDIADPRESPAFEIIELLRHRGAEVAYHDPHVPVAPAMRTWPDLPPMRSVALDGTVLAAQDAAIVVTNHQAIDWDLVLAHAPLIVDTRGVYRRAASHVVPA